MIFALILAAVLQAPQDPKGFWERDTLTGDWDGVRTSLADHGLTTTLEFTGEVISNVHGGVQHDTGLEYLLDWVIEADFDRMIRWTGGSGKLNPMWLAGDGITGAVGDLTHISNIEGFGTVRVFEFWLQQAILDGALSLRAGILAADQEFAITESGLLYYNSVFGGPVFLSGNLTWPIYPVGAPGLRLRVEPAAKTYVQAAVYDGDPGSERINEHGGRIRLSHGEGVFSILEGGWHFGEGCPGALKAGLFYHTADFVEFATGKPGGPLGGGYALYEQRVWTDGPLPGALDAFVRAGAADPERAFIQVGVDAGLNFTGVIPGRPADVLGLGVIYARVSQDFARVQPDAPLWGYESVLEATYKIVLSPAWNFQPGVQYVFHPGGSSALSNATILGLRIDLLF